MSAPPVEKTASGRVQIAAPTLGIRADKCQPMAERSPPLRQHKASLYARALVPDYWIVDINDELVEVYRRVDRAARHRGLE